MTNSKNLARYVKIRSCILMWSAQHPRDLPWKSSRDPYVIWVSEIILQQTRIDQGIPYFRRFIEKYPTIHDLAKTEENELMKIWEGLGYYRRAQNMFLTAQKIVEEMGGVFPGSYQKILELRGVGPYTAAAIASFAYDLPHVVIDGNVLRVIARLEGITESIEKSSTKRRIEEIANRLLDRNDPSSFNQAIMDFGATHCKPYTPNCHDCLLIDECQAHILGLTQNIPAKKIRKPKRIRYFYYLLYIHHDEIYVRKRTGSDIWQNLYEFYLIERDSNKEWSSLLQDERIPMVKSHSTSERYRQVLSHQVIFASFLVVELPGRSSFLKKKGFEPVKTKNIKNFAFPKVIDCYLKDKGVILD